MAYVYQEFPRIVYHRSGETKTVNSAQELASLGPDWSKTPTSTEPIEESPSVEGVGPPAEELLPPKRRGWPRK